MLLFERDLVPGDYGLVEGKPRFRTVPLDEFSDCMIVGSLRTRRSQAVKNADFDCSRSGSLRTDLAARLRFILVSAIQSGINEEQGRLLQAQSAAMQNLAAEVRETRKTLRHVKAQAATGQLTMVAAK
jgi:hypothetical protein